MKMMEEIKKTTEDNIHMSQEKQKAAYARKVQKKYSNIVYNVGDEVLLLNMRKRGRKGGRIEPDFFGTYVIQTISGKLVTLKNTEGTTLKNKYNIDHIKPYRRSSDSQYLSRSKDMPKVLNDNHPIHTHEKHLADKISSDNSNLQTASDNDSSPQFAEHFLLTGRIDGVETTSLAVSAARMEIACSLLKCRGNAEDYCVICTMLQGDANKSMVEMHWPALVSDRCRGFTENSRRTDGEEPSFPAPALLGHSELRAPARGKRGKFAASVIITCYTCVHHANSLAGQFSRVL
ncbi:hypothetical protein SRHO_G00212470 [Serrasalmus rhombeus]